MRQSRVPARCKQRCNLKTTSERTRAGGSGHDALAARIVRAAGDAMQGVGAAKGDALLVDPSLMAAHASVVIRRGDHRMIQDDALSELAPTATRCPPTPSRLHARSRRTTDAGRLQRMSYDESSTRSRSLPSAYCGHRRALRATGSPSEPLSRAIRIDSAVRTWRTAAAGQRDRLFSTHQRHSRPRIRRRKAAVQGASDCLALQIFDAS